MPGGGGLCSGLVRAGHPLRSGGNVPPGHRGTCRGGAQQNTAVVHTRDLESGWAPGLTRTPLPRTPPEAASGRPAGVPAGQAGQPWALEDNAMLRHLQALMVELQRMKCDLPSPGGLTGTVPSRLSLWGL